MSIPRYVGRVVLMTSVFCMPLAAFAATKTWDGGGADSLWSTAANWDGDTRPGTGDTIVFDGTGKKDAIILSNSFKYDIGDLQLQAANTGTLTIRKPVTVLHNISLSGGTLTVASGAQITVKGSWQNGGGTYSAGTGTVVLSGSGTSYVLKETSAFRNLSIDDGLVGYWRFDELTGTGAIDSSRNQITGAYKEGSTRSTVIPTLGFQNRTSASFDGTDDYVSLSSTVKGQTNVTLSAWVKPAVFQNGYYNTVFWESRNDGIGYARFVLWIYDNGTIEFGGRANDVGSFQYKDSVPTVPVNIWSHVVGVWNGSTGAISIFINGTQVSTTGTGIAGSLANTDTLGGGIGNDYQGDYMNGLIDDLRLYNRSLSSSEIQALYSGEQGTGSGKYTLGSNLTVNGNLNIYSGTLDASTSNYGVTASGSFTNNARFTPRSGTVTLSGIATSLKLYGTSLYNLTIASAKSAILRTAATVTNAFTIASSAIFNLNGNTLTATSATISNSATLTEGTGSLLHRATLAMTPATVTIGGTITITLTDADENIDGTVQDTVTVLFDSTSLTLTETTANSGIFQRSIPTVHGTPSGDHSTYESLDRCNFFLTTSFADVEDSTDGASVTIEVTDPAVCTSSTTSTASGGGGGGGSRGMSAPTIDAVSRTITTTVQSSTPASKPVTVPRPKTRLRIPLLSRLIRRAAPPSDTLLPVSNGPTKTPSFTPPRVRALLPVTASDNERFLAQLYLDLLHRPIDPVGRTMYLDALSKNFSRGWVVLNLLESPEYRLSLITELYNTMYHRAPTAEEQQSALAALKNGTTRESLTADLLGRASPSLDALYLATLGRTPDATERAQAQQRLQAIGARMFAFQLLKSTEGRSLRIQNFYRSFLERDADPTALATYVSALSAVWIDDLVIVSILKSEEYMRVLR